MAKRSPILGFNHNFRHRGLVFHVQTEDSGVNNPHIFTHLFNGGVILSTRKLTYDAGAANEVVKALMQAQHKAMLKDLKRGDFDDKIDEYFGADEDLVHRPTFDSEPTHPSAEAPIEIEVVGPVVEVESADEIDELELDLDDIELVAAQDTATDMPAARSAAAAAFADLEVDLIGSPTDTLRSAAPPAPIGETASGAVIIHAAAPESAPDPPGAKPTSPGSYAKHTGKIKKLLPDDVEVEVGGEVDGEVDGGIALEPMAPLVEPDSHRNLNNPVGGPVPLPPRLAGNEVRGKGREDSVKLPRTATQPLQSEPSEVPRRRKSSGVVTKQSVIVGAPPRVVGGTPAGKKGKPRRAREGGSSLFGKDLISEKSLDEVILAYLSEDGKERE